MCEAGDFSEQQAVLNYINKHPDPYTGKAHKFITSSDVKMLSVPPPIDRACERHWQYARLCTHGAVRMTY